jgi:hypothetical protein
MGNKRNFSQLYLCCLYGCENMSKRKRIMPLYYDPDPIDPATLTWIALGLIALFLWTNPNAINNIMFMLNPQLAKLEEEKIKAQQETIRYIVLMVLVIAGVVILIYFMERKKRRRVIA